MSADVNILLLPQPPYSSTLFFGGVFVVVVHLVLEKVVIVVDVVEQVMMEQGQGRLAGIVLSSSWLPSLPLPAAQSVCSPSTVNIVHLHLANHDALPSLPWRNNMGEGNEVLLAPKLRQNLHQCNAPYCTNTHTNARTAAAPMA